MTQGPDTLTQLERLARLRDTGALSADEFAREKARLLRGKVEPARSGRGRWWWVMGGALGVTLVAVAALLFGRSLSVDRPAGTAVADYAAPYDRVAEAITPVPSPTPTPTTSSSPASDLSAPLRFANIANCEFAPEGDRAFTSMLDINRLTGRPRPLAPVVLGELRLAPVPDVRNMDAQVEGGRIYASEVRLPAGATWNGLRLGRLVAEHGSYPDTDDYDARALTFREPPEKVRATLARLGVEVTPGRYAGLTDDTCGGAMEINAITGGAELRCTWGC